MESKGVKRSSPQSKTITFEEIPDWMKDNHYIRTGYRRPQGTYSGCIASLFTYLHNETVNAWSHLLGTIAFAILLGVTIVPQYFPRLYSRLFHENTVAATTIQRKHLLAPFYLISPFASQQTPNVTWHDTLAVGVFIVSAIICLFFSTTLHTLSCHSEKVAKPTHKLDYVGIVILIVGSFVPALHYAFFCDPYLQLFYIGGVSMAGFAAGYVVLSPKYSRVDVPFNRRLRTGVFIALGLFAIFPVVHGLQLYGLQKAADNFSLGWLALSGALYIVGALMYAERVPERFTPGSFDILGASHQIFHILILFAAWAHYAAVAEGFRFWHGEAGGVCPGHGTGESFRRVAGEL